jgi:O-antigen/teichoic acid export membrane protein
MTTAPLSTETIAEVLPGSGTGGKGQRAVLLGMVGKLAIISVNAATGIITARALLPIGRGEQAAMSLWPILLSNATTLGLPAALSFYLKRPGSDRSRLVSAALMLGAAITLLSGIAAAVLMPRLLGHYSLFVVFSARWFLFSLPVGSFMLLARSVLEADGQFDVSVISQWLLPTLTLVLLIGFLLFGRLTPVTATIAYTANGLPVAYWLFKRLKRVVTLRVENPLSQAKQLLSYGLPAYGVDLCGTLSANVDQAMVVSFLSPDAMGVYGVALSVSRMLNFCQTSVTMVLLPKAAGSPPELVASLTGRAARASLFVTGMAAICVSVIAPIVIRTLYGRDFESAIAPFRILLIESVVGSTVVVLAQAAMALGRPALVTLLQLCGLVITIPLMFVLLPRFGLVGAALSITASTCVRLVLMLLSFPMLLGYPAPRLWLTGPELMSLVTSGLDMLLPKRLQVWSKAR